MIKNLCNSFQFNKNGIAYFIGNRIIFISINENSVILMEYYYYLKFSDPTYKLLNKSFEKQGHVRSIGYKLRQLQCKALSESKSPSVFTPTIRKQICSHAVSTY